MLFSTCAIGRYHGGVEKVAVGGVVYSVPGYYGAK